jgi:hypothetical protein
MFQLKREISELAILESYIESLPASALGGAAGGVSKRNIDHLRAEAKAAAAIDAALAKGHGTEGDAVAGGSHKARPASTQATGVIGSSGKQQEETEDGDEEADDPNVARMKSAISAMVGKLKVKIDVTEKVGTPCHITPRYATLCMHLM